MKWYGLEYFAPNVKVIILYVILLHSALITAILNYSGILLNLWFTTARTFYFKKINIIGLKYWWNWDAQTRNNPKLSKPHVYSKRPKTGIYLLRYLYTAVFIQGYC